MSSRNRWKYPRVRFQLSWRWISYPTPDYLLVDVSNHEAGSVAGECQRRGISEDADSGFRHVYVLAGSDDGELTIHKVPNRVTSLGFVGIEGSYICLGF